MDDCSLCCQADFIMARNADPVASSDHSSGLSFRLRLALSALLLVHVLAVLVPPFTFATSSGPGLASPFATPIIAILQPYIDSLFLDHGYFFFAPNPGPSHLMRAKLEFADGRPDEELVFPDRRRHKPRLLYHRHFMLAEQLHSEFAPPNPPPGIANDPEQRARWEGLRQLYEMRKNSFEEHLKATYGASRVTVHRIEHRLFGPSEFQQSRRPLDEADTYRELPEQPDERPAALPGGAR